MRRLFLFVLAAALISLGSAEWFVYRKNFNTNQCTSTATNLKEGSIWPNNTCVGGSMPSSVTCDSNGVSFWIGCTDTRSLANFYPLGCDTSLMWSYHCIEAASVDELLKSEFQLSETYTGIVVQKYRLSDTSCANPAMFMWVSPTGSFAFCSEFYNTWAVNGSRAEISSCTDAECTQCSFDGQNFINLESCDAVRAEYQRALTIPGPVPPVEAPANAPVDTPIDVPIEAPVDSPIAAPVDAPAEAPVDTPIDTPADTPVSAPISAPVSNVDAPLGAPSSAAHVAALLFPGVFAFLTSLL